MAHKVRRDQVSTQQFIVPWTIWRGILNRLLWGAPSPRLRVARSLAGQWTRLMKAIITTQFALVLSPAMKPSPGRDIPQVTERVGPTTRVARHAC
jgi:hypothetical protein